MTARAFTANRLDDGAVVFLDGNYRWTERFADARLFTTDGESEDLTRIAGRAEATGHVIGAYTIEVKFDPRSASAVPALLRERIRAFGPTVSSHSAHMTG